MTKSELIKKHKLEIEELKESMATVYVSDTSTLYQRHGELRVLFNDHTGPRTLVLDATNLYRDLSAWVNLTKKANSEMQKMYCEQLKDAINE